MGTRPHGIPHADSTYSTGGVKATGTPTALGGCNCMVGDSGGAACGSPWLSLEAAASPRADDGADPGGQALVRNVGGAVSSEAATGSAKATDVAVPGAGPTPLISSAGEPCSGNAIPGA